MTTQIELPKMPMNTDLGNACDDYIVEHDKLNSVKDKLTIIGDRIMEELKKEKKNSIRYKGYQFFIKESSEKLQFSEVKK